MLKELFLILNIIIGYYGKKKWGRGNLVSLGIGQGELSVTTLQLAQYTALLANFGKTKITSYCKRIYGRI